MPRYYCDYCDTYLTHDSQAGRKQHNRGWKHRENVKLYYEQFIAGQLGGSEVIPGAWLRPLSLPGNAPPGVPPFARPPPPFLLPPRPGFPPRPIPPGIMMPRGLPPQGMPPNSTNMMAPSRT